MQDFYRRVEAFAKASDGLRGQPDLRHQHQRLLTFRQDIFQHAEVNLGFAGSGDPGQQPGGKLIVFTADRAHGGGLFGIEPQPFTEYGKARPPILRCYRLRTQVDQAFCTQRLERAFRQFQFAHLMAIHRAL
ncbi:hypothetical protein D3C75_965750 [compost metagenome]